MTLVMVDHEESPTHDIQEAWCLASPTFHVIIIDVLLLFR